MLLRLTYPSSHEKNIDFRKSVNEDTVQYTGICTDWTTGTGNSSSPDPSISMCLRLGVNKLAYVCLMVPDSEHQNSLGWE